MKGFQYLLPVGTRSRVAGRPAVHARAAARPGGWPVARGLRFVPALALGVLLLSLAVPAFQITRPSTSRTFLAGSGGVPGGREMGTWIRANVPAGASMLTVGPSMANIVSFYGHRKAYGLSVSANPLRRNPSYEPAGNPNRRIQQSDLQYVVWDAFSAARSQVLLAAALQLREHVPRARGLHVHGPRAAWRPDRGRARDPDLRGAPEMIRALLLCTVALLAVAPAAGAADPEPATPIKHFVVLMQENHTFDNYFGTYPGADGPPADVCMPKKLGDPTAGCEKREWLGNSPTLDLLHSSDVAREQYNGGKMDGFVDAFTRRDIDDAKPMGYYDDRDLPYYWNLADNYVLFDRFFASAARRHPSGTTCSGSRGRPATRPVDVIPPEGFNTKTTPTIFDRLSAKGISWKFYVQNYDPTITAFNTGSLTDNDKLSQPIWVPLLAYREYVDEPRAVRAHRRHG